MRSTLSSTISLPKKFEVLEQAAVEAFKLGYEVTDAEELEVGRWAPW
ncbi:Regulator of ribonuclease activity B [Serratia fonticola]|uniref:Regulator of ribonuclease activity B n=1 Tax=Serratia fonticola TaxID=47917 RepID=A0A4U9TP99_SERFO|nr:Regulator of ribonuclease activity B [Serratia fonticola]